MGTANIIPGASGGTVALILGIYRRLITAISHFDRQWIGLVVRRQLIAASEHVDLRFLVSLVLGIVAATIVFGRLIHTLLTEYEAGEYEGGTLAVFFGLIVASTILVARRVSQWNITNSVLAILGGSVAYMIASASPGGNGIPVGLFYLFCCGAIAISAMILPGISGALILKLLGVYTQVTGYLKDFSNGAFSLDNILSIGVHKDPAGSAEPLL